MFRYNLHAKRLAHDFLSVKNPIIAKQYPEEAHCNAQLVQIIISSNYDDRYMNQMVASYMGVGLQHPLSTEVFRIANSVFHGDERL